MQRIALAILVVVIVIALAALLLRGASRVLNRVGTTPEIASGGTMQKVSFFLLLCLILYVSVSGGS